MLGFLKVDLQLLHVLQNKMVAGRILTLTLLCLVSLLYMPPSGHTFMAPMFYKPGGLYKSIKIRYIFFKFGNCRPNLILEKMFWKNVVFQNCSVFKILHKSTKKMVFVKIQKLKANSIFEKICDLWNDVFSKSILFQHCSVSRIPYKFLRNYVFFEI